VVLSGTQAQDLVASLDQTFARVRSQLGPLQVVLGCDCVLRRIMISNTAAQSRLSSLLVQNRVVGFNTYGEQFNAMHVNQTFTGIAIGYAGHHAAASGVSMEPAVDLSRADKPALLQYIVQLEKDNAKLRKINNALIYRVESGMADNGNSFTIFQVSAELEKRIQERTHALERAINDLKTSNIALEEARLAAEQANNRLGVAVDTIADGFAQWDQHDRWCASTSALSNCCRYCAAMYAPACIFLNIWIIWPNPAACWRPWARPNRGAQRSSTTTAMAAIWSP
jgi:hypothetical protein